jgi:hypothetical protein
MQLWQPAAYNHDDQAIASMVAHYLTQTQVSNLSGKKLARSHSRKLPHIHAQRAMDYIDSDVEVVADAEFERTIRVEPNRTVFVGRFPYTSYPDKKSTPVVEDARVS